MDNSVAIRYVWLNSWYERRDSILHILFGCSCWLWAYSRRQLSHNHLAAISAIKHTAVNILLNQRKNPHAPISTCNRGPVPVNFSFGCSSVLWWCYIPTNKNRLRNKCMYMLIALCEYCIIISSFMLERLEWLFYPGREKKKQPWVSFISLLRVAAQAKPMNEPNTVAAGRGVTKPLHTKKRTDSRRNSLNTPLQPLCQTLSECDVPLNPNVIMALLRRSLVSQPHQDLWGRRGARVSLRLRKTHGMNLRLQLVRFVSEEDGRVSS